MIDISDLSEVAKRLPQFEILELIGRGGMGVVYKARQPQLDRIVALKILPPLDALSPDFVARFTREARSLAKLNHPNIVHVHDFGETGGLYYIIMEYVDGANLRQLLESRRLTPAEALAIVPKICDALEYAHEEGLVHRDIKPENLLIDKRGRVRIADFGLAKLLRREALDLSLTLSGMSLGTIRYMAPEQMDRPDTVDHRADIYSLGVVIYEMLTGELPVGRFDLPSQKAPVDARLDQIVLHALERDVDRRYQHASEVRTDVERVSATPASVVPKTPTPDSGIKSPHAISEHPRRHFLQAILSLLFLITFIFAVNTRAQNNRVDGGRASKVRVGSIDPLFVYDSHPHGFSWGFSLVSWSAFSAVLAGVICAALIRIEREDSGKVPRDREWWIGFWKQVGFWCGLLLAACIVRTYLHPEVLNRTVMEPIPRELALPG
jgi:serine/threonine protein kinase